MEFLEQISSNLMSVFLDHASSYAGKVDFLIVFITVTVFFWFFLVLGVFLYFCWKYRHREGHKAGYFSGESHEETKIIHWAHRIIIGIDAVLIAGAIFVWYNIKQHLPNPDETIRVIGQQWTWTFVHPGLDHKLGTEDDVATVDELHVVKGKTYHFLLESRDVLHSFSIPVFRLKQDAVPGRVITGWFKPTKTGTFDVQCAEICGIGHGIMVSKIVVEEDDDYETWLKDMMAKGMKLGAN